MPTPLQRQNTVHGDEMYGKIFEVSHKDYITSEGEQTEMNEIADLYDNLLSTVKKTESKLGTS